MSSVPFRNLSPALLSSLVDGGDAVSAIALASLGTTARSNQVMQPPVICSPITTDFRLAGNTPAGLGLPALPRTAGLVRGQDLLASQNIVPTNTLSSSTDSLASQVSLAIAAAAANHAAVCPPAQTMARKPRVAKKTPTARKHKLLPYSYVSRTATVSDGEASPVGHLRSTSSPAAAKTETTTRKRASRMCKVQGCPNTVVQGGVCISHGAKRKQCKMPGCTKSVKKAGLCSAHGPARKRCEHAGCGNTAVQGGLCISHGARKRLCEVQGCTKKGKATWNHMCKRHFDLSSSFASHGLGAQSQGQGQRRRT